MSLGTGSTGGRYPHLGWPNTLTWGDCVATWRMLKWFMINRCSCRRRHLAILVHDDITGPGNRYFVYAFWYGRTNNYAESAIEIGAQIG